MFLKQLSDILNLNFVLQYFIEEYIDDTLSRDAKLYKLFISVTNSKLAFPEFEEK